MTGNLESATMNKPVPEYGDGGQLSENPLAAKMAEHQVVHPVAKPVVKLPETVDTVGDLIKALCDSAEGLDQAVVMSFRNSEGFNIASVETDENGNLVLSDQ